jgi:transcriptional regulator with XRE-family HTH domain
MAAAAQSRGRWCRQRERREASACSTGRSGDSRRCVLHEGIHVSRSGHGLEHPGDRGRVVRRGTPRNEALIKVPGRAAPLPAQGPCLRCTYPWGNVPQDEPSLGKQRAQYVIMTGMSDPMPEAVDVEELGALLRERRAQSGRTLREVAAETGVPIATLSRVESGRLPDLRTFRNIVEWLGIPPERFFPTPRVKNETTPETVAQVLRSDSTLSETAREQLVSTFAQMYTMLSVKEQLVQVHLRSHRLFKPAAGELLADLLQEMLRKLDEEEGV